MAIKKKEYGHGSLLMMRELLTVLPSIHQEEEKEKFKHRAASFHFTLYYICEYLH